MNCVGLCSIERSFESGLVMNCFYKSNRGLISLLEKNIKLYRSPEEFTDDLSLHARQSEVRFENLVRAFSSYFAILACAWIGFLVHWSMLTIRRLLKMVHLKMRFFRFILIEQSRAIKRRFSR